MYSKHNSKLLYAAQYPIYGVATDGGGRIYLVGGGGHGNYGVPNMIEVLKHSEDSDKVMCVEEVTAGAFNNIGLANDNRTLVVGLEGDAVLYRLNVSEKAASQLTQQAVSKPPKTEKEPFQTAVSNICSYRVACGSANSYVAVHNIRADWSHLEPLLTIKTPRQVDDVTLTQDGCTVAIACRTDTLYVWTLPSPDTTAKDATKKHDLKWSYHDVAYHARACQFGSAVLEGDSEKVAQSQPLYVGFIAPNKHASKLPSCLVKYDVETGRDLAHRYLSKRQISSLGVSVCGRYVGVGDMEGGLVVLDHNLNMVTSSQAHGLFVTDITFLTNADGGERPPNMLSVSADRNCAMTPCVPAKGSLRWLYVLVLLLLTALIYYLATAEEAAVQDL
eukprot:m.39282 g.39282  ORF g.39282 m.39282 type:complete len:389 (+) comp12657_c0_seq1:194-1360(+)